MNRGHPSKLKTKMLLKFLTVVFSIPALGSDEARKISPVQNTLPALKGFKEHLQKKQITEFKNSLQRGPQIGQIQSGSGKTTPVFSGGWNGSGGGGGLSCFKDEAEMKSWIEPDGRAKQGWLNAIQNFQMLDLYDMEYPATWPENDFNIEDFLRARIRKRLETHFPVLAEKLLSEFDLVLRAQWFPSQSLKVIEDTGPLISGKQVPKNCLYGQWAQRLQNTEMKTAVYVLMYNQSLDERLKNLLSEREYKIQRAVLSLHEALYGGLFHASLKDSGYTRWLMTLILMPDSVFDNWILNSRNNGLFGYIWIGETLPVLTKTSEEFLEFQKESGKSSSNWQQYINFLKKMEYAMKEVSRFMDKQRMAPFNTFKAVTFGTSENSLLRSITYVIFASDWSALTGQNTERITNLEGFYLLATELETQKRVESVQRLALIETTHPDWKLACEQVKAQELIWKSLPKPQTEEERMILGVSQWIASKAMRYCTDQKIRGAAK